MKKIFANELTPLKKYRVHGYHVVRHVMEVEGKSQTDAINQYDKEFRVDMLFGRDAESAEEVNGYLVDEDGDEEYENSQFYCCDGKTAADNKCTQCCRELGSQ